MPDQTTEAITTRKDTLRLAISYQSPHNLNLRPQKVRQHTKKQIRQLAASIKAFGFIVPIIMDAENNVIAGEARLQAALQLGLREVPIICAFHLTEAEVLAFSIADNRLSELGSWDEQVLANVLKKLSDFDLGFSLEATGFDMGEIDFRIANLDSPAEEPDPADQQVLSAPTLPISKLGDLWVIGGKHRIYCGNALEQASYERLMQGKMAALVFNDPPYNVPIDGHVCGNGAIQHDEFVMASGEMNESQFTSFLTTALSLCAKHSAEGSIHYVCMDWRHLIELLIAGKAAYTELKNICTWVKSSAGMGSLYRSQHELILVFKKGQSAHQNNIQLGKHGRHRTNVWNYPSVSAFGRHTEEGSLLAIHPTVKPVAMVADAIIDCSARWDIVLDAFLGSGTTLMAAERTGRICYGMEIDPIYVDAAIRRFQKYTGQKAVHSVTGLSFDEMTLEEKND